MWQRQQVKSTGKKLFAIIFQQKGSKSTNAAAAAANTILNILEEAPPPKIVSKPKVQQTFGNSTRFSSHSQLSRFFYKGHNMRTNGDNSGRIFIDWKKLTITSKKLCKCSTLQERGKNWKKVRSWWRCWNSLGDIWVNRTRTDFSPRHHQSSSTISDNNQFLSRILFCRN